MGFPVTIGRAVRKIEQDAKWHDRNLTSITEYPTECKCNVCGKEFVYELEWEYVGTLPRKTTPEYCPDCCSDFTTSCFDMDALDTDTLSTNDMPIYQ